MPRTGSPNHDFLCCGSSGQRGRMGRESDVPLFFNWPLGGRPAGPWPPQRQRPAPVRSVRFGSVSFPIPGRWPPSARSPAPRPSPVPLPVLDSPRPEFGIPRAGARFFRFSFFLGFRRVVARAAGRTASWTAGRLVLPRRADGDRQRRAHGGPEERKFVRVAGDWWWQWTVVGEEFRRVSLTGALNLCRVATTRCFLPFFFPLSQKLLFCFHVTAERSGCHV